MAENRTIDLLTDTTGKEMVEAIGRQTAALIAASSNKYDPDTTLEEVKDLRYIEGEEYLTAGEAVRESFKKVNEQLIAHKEDQNNPHRVTKETIGLGEVVNKKPEDYEIGFTEEEGDTEELVSGEKFSLSLSKIAKAVKNFIQHKSDDKSHVTEDERKKWNSTVSLDDFVTEDSENGVKNKAINEALNQFRYYTYEVEKEEDLSLYLNDVDTVLQNNVTYRRNIAVLQEGLSLPKGTWVLDGVKEDADNGWQRLTKSEDNELLVLSRAKSEGVWSNWKQQPIDDGAYLRSGDSSYELGDFGTEVVGTIRGKESGVYFRFEDESGVKGDIGFNVDKEPVIRNNGTEEHVLIHSENIQDYAVPKEGGTADKAKNDADGKEITKTYIKSVEISGTTVKITWGDGTSREFNTQDTVYTHPSSGVTAGTYRSVTVDAKGHVTSASNPTLAISQGGTGATDAATAKSNIGLGNVPNVATNDQTPTFSQASSRANIASGEKLSVILGKVMKFFTDLKTVAFSGSYNDLSNKPTIPAAVAVKGNAESSYRTGNVNLTPANIGAAPSTHSQAASTITTGILGGQISANRDAMKNVGTSQVRDIVVKTTVTEGATATESEGTIVFTKS